MSIAPNPPGDALTPGMEEPGDLGAILVEAPLLEPRDGIPEVVSSQAALEAAAATLGALTGPVAIDAERASGYRYGQRAYLVQLHRVGAAAMLVDPMACQDLSVLDEALADAEWVVHAATQDLPCLAEIGLRPRRLFDTELAGRLAGFDRVGLASMVESMLGVRLDKGHSAADWSTRPLPEPWLRYAVLDVEPLLDLRDALERVLADQGKLDWARQEFEAVRTAPTPPPRTDPWRRTSGIHRLRQRRQMAIVRAMWQVRDSLARELDISPTRLLPDSAIVAVAKAGPTSRAQLVALEDFIGRGSRRHLRQWWNAISEAIALDENDLPEVSAPYDGPPPVMRWADRDPEAATRLVAVRAVLQAKAEELRLPVENLLQPDASRRLAWEPPEPISVESVAASLQRLGARAWQLDLTAEALATALVGATRSDDAPNAI
jgi:ribonuclease D